MTQGVNFTVLDQGLGLAPAGNGNTTCVIGTSSIGTVNQPLQTPNATSFVTTFGYGPGPELAAKVANDNGNTVIFVKVAGTVAGTNTAVTATRVSGSTSVVTITGVPFDSYYGNATVLTGGTIGTTGITIALSLDAARTVYATINLLTTTSYAIPNTNLTINFGAGTLTAGDVFTWVSAEPMWSDAGVASAIQSLLSITTQPVDIFIPGITASGDATSFQTQAASTLFNKKRFCRILAASRDALWGGSSTETEQQWITSITADFAAVQADRVGVTAGFYNFISPISQTQFRRPLLWGAASRDAGVAIQVDLGEVDKGSIPMVLPSTPDGYIYHDENVIGGLDAARFMACWSIAGLPGLYIMNPNLMAAPGSDFKWLQYGHVVDAACVIAYQFFVQRLSSPVRVNSTTGYILQQDANTLITGCNRALANGLTNANAVSSATTQINQTENILSLQRIDVTVQIVPLAYLKTINVSITFLNPALQAVQNMANAG
jgi:hypothetical protein